MKGPLKTPTPAQQRVKSLLLGAKALSPRLVGAAKVQRQVERNRPRSKQIPAGTPAFGINKNLAPQKASNVLDADSRLNNPGPTAMERMDE